MYESLKRSGSIRPIIPAEEDGTVLLRGNVHVSITGPLELRADEIDISPDGREMTVRNNVTVRFPADVRLASPPRQ